MLIKTKYNGNIINCGKITSNMIKSDIFLANFLFFNDLDLILRGYFGKYCHIF